MKKQIKAWIAILPAYERPTSSGIAFCPDGKENDTCLRYDVFEREAAAVQFAKQYPEACRKVVPVTMTFDL